MIFYEQSVSADGTVCYVPVTDRAVTQAETLKKELADLQSSFNLAAGHRDSYQKRCQEYSKAIGEISVILGYPHIEGATISIDGLVSLVREKFENLNKEIVFQKKNASGINDQLVALKKETDIIKRQRDILALDKQTVINVNEAFRNQIENLKQNEDLSKRLFAEKEALLKQNEALTKEIIALKKKPEEPEERKERISKMETVTFKDQIISVLNNKALKGDAWMNINTFTELLSKNIYSFDVYTDRNLLVEGIYGRWSNPDRQICVSQYVPEGVIKLDSKKVRKEIVEEKPEPTYSDIEKEIKEGIEAIKEGRYNLKGLGPLVAEAIENLFKLRNYR